MPAVKLLLNTNYESKNHTYPVCIRVHHRQKRKYIPTGVDVREDQFKDGHIIKHPNAQLLNSRISNQLSAIQKYIADCQLHGKEIRLDRLDSAGTSHSYTEYLDHRAAQYKAKGQIVMDQKLRRFAAELRDCFSGEVHFDDITQDALRKFDAHLIQAGNVENTRNKKFKFLRQFFNHAFEEGKTDQRNPFNQYKIPKKPVRKEKLTLKDIEAIEQADLSGAVNDARNLFLFSYYSQGSRFENCVTLTRSQISRGRIQIKTNKGGKYISVKIHSRLQSLLDQYKGKPLVFPFLSHIPTDPKEYLQAIGSQNAIVNRNLKIVAAICELNIHLTFHVARHSLAQHLKEKSASIHVIKEVLGHSDTKTTEIYLRSLGNDALDSEMERLYGE